MRRKAIHAVAGLAILFLALAQFRANTEPFRWLATHALFKIRPDTPIPRGNWGVDLYAARNEFEPFQVILRAEAADLDEVDVEVRDFRGPGGAVLPRHHATVYLQEYVTLTNPSSVEGATGEWPDPLIPRIDRYTGERRNAFPFTVSRGRNRTVWIELYVPPDTAPGSYSGAVDIRMTGQDDIEVPVTLRVWQFSLPSTSTLKTSFGLNGLGILRQHYGRYTNDSDLRNFTYLYKKAALLHRLSTHGDTLTPPPFTEHGDEIRIDWRDYDDEVGPFLDGHVFNEADPLHGARATTVDLRTHGSLHTDDQKVRYWRDWVRYFSERGWLDRLFYYVWDEPAPDQYLAVAERARLSRRVEPRIPTLVTVPLVAPLRGLVDIWTPLINCFELKPGFSPFCEPTVPYAAYEAEISDGQRLWWYQSCGSHGCNIVGGDYFRGWPSYVVDIGSVAARVMQWMTWKYNIEGELYYNLNELYSGGGNPWDDIRAHGGNGDGTLFYPGRPDRIGGTTHIPVESIRLKLIREGLEDYEYLALLSAAGLQQFAQNLVDRLVQNAHHWEAEPEVLYGIRREIGERLDEHYRERQEDGGEEVRLR